jgi:predicted phosphodiesterase
MIAIISDVHGNLEALRAVLAEVRDADVTYCAGDIVGYGPNPNECCEMIRERGIRSVQGNHDFVSANLDRVDALDDTFSEEDRALCRDLYEQKNSAAQIASQWTNSVLTAENKEYLRGLPLQVNEHGLTIVHGKPGSRADMLNEYLLPGYVDKGITDTIEGHVLVVGHSHIPMRAERVVNPGSVGQPRDRNWRASFATFKDVWYRFTYIRDEDMSFRIVSQVVSIRRVPYDVNKTIRKIKETRAIPDTLGERLIVGL